MDYLLAKRFLKTTYNNLVEIDIKILTPTIEKFDKELKHMDFLYNAFNNKTNYPGQAYTKVFLAFQPEYKEAKKALDYVIDTLHTLRTREQLISASLAAKKNELNKNVNSSKFVRYEKEFKILNGLYSDTIHSIAELDDRRKYDLKLLHKFEQKYLDAFNKAFREISVIYNSQIIEILNALAYILDDELWKEAKKSEDIKLYFKDSSIKENLNTQTYLKHYLDALDADKANEDTIKLFELYEYLKSINKQSVLVVVSSPQDAIEYETTIKKFNPSINIKAFIDEKAALKWAMTNNVNLLVIEDTLRQITAEKFMNFYKKHIFLTPKLVIIGNKPKSCPFTPDKTLSKGVSSKVVSDNVKILLF